MTQDSKWLLKLSAKLLVVWLVLSGLGALYGQSIINAGLPLMQNIAQHITDDFYSTLSWDQKDPGMLLIDASFGVPKPSIRALGIQPGASASAGTNVEHILVPLVLLFVVVICWPVTGWKSRGLLILMSLPTAVVTLLSTTPFLLVGKIETLLQEYAYNAQVVRDQPLYLDWMLFTESGGRWLLPISLGLVCVWTLNKFIVKDQRLEINE